PFILSILGYIFDISKKTGILTHVKMPVFRQSESPDRSPGFLCMLADIAGRLFAGRDCVSRYPRD
ncbi:hypothetical protein, partial [Thermoclostridium caenicola]|uniref:hypothetical protein n=1 Tax=Thermoclostridium caenicola TaxID=659425 RepID=UPI001A9B314E